METPDGLAQSISQGQLWGFVVLVMVLIGLQLRQTWQAGQTTKELKTIKEEMMTKSDLGLAISTLKAEVLRETRGEFIAQKEADIRFRDIEYKLHHRPS